MEECEWSANNLHKLDEYFKEHEKVLSSKSKRGETRRKALYLQIAKELSNKFSIRAIINKIDHLYLNWGVNDQLALVEFYHSKPLLWSSTHPEYRNLDLRDEAITELQGLLSKHYSDTEIKTKWTNLVTVWRRKQRQQPKRIKRSARTFDKIYDSLQFLAANETDNPQKSVSTPPKTRSNKFSTEKINNIKYENDSSYSRTNSIDNLDQENGDDGTGSDGSDHFEDKPLSSSSNEEFDTDYDYKFEKHKTKKSEARKRLRIDNEKYSTHENSLNGNQAFGVSVASSLDKLSDIGQEYAKLEIQKVLAEFRKRESMHEPPPVFTVNRRNN